MLKCTMLTFGYCWGSDEIVKSQVYSLLNAYLDTRDTSTLTTLSQAPANAV